jgi:HTH-type transcriptional regulator/antitoxin HigA
MSLKYKVIKSKKQYFEYCDILEKLTTTKTMTKELEEEVDLLTVLIEKWDQDNDPFIHTRRDPVQSLRSFMDNRNMKSKDLVELLEVSKGYVSDILNYKKGFSKQVIRKLADHFKVRQDAFNRPYELKGMLKQKVKKSVIGKSIQRAETSNRRKRKETVR